MLISSFLTARIFQEIFGGEPKQFMEKNVSYEEDFPKISLAKLSVRQKSSNSPSRGIFWTKIFLETRTGIFCIKIMFGGTKPSQVKLSRPLSLFAHLVPSTVPSVHVFHTMSLSLSSSLEVTDDAWYLYTVHSPG